MQGSHNNVAGSGKEGIVGTCYDVTLRLCEIKATAGSNTSVRSRLMYVS
uniref:Uncharacterized protein n=1 Tax=Anguilla anguilla TaxID=7936 RepID=A0A0E9UYP7_ANGAN